MTVPELLAVAGLTLACATVAGGLGLLTLRLLARASLMLRLIVVAAATVVSIAGGMASAASLINFSARDLTVFYSIAAVSGLISIALAGVLGRSLERDQRYVGAAAASNRVGEIGASPDRHTNHEFAALAGELAASGVRLAAMRERESQIEGSRRELVAWISHDLRTPLAGIRAMAEALEDGMVEDPDRYYAQIRGQVDRLTGMVDDLFALSRIHAGTLQLTLEPVSLYDLISDTVADLAPVATAKSLDLRFEGEQGLTALADPRELARVVGNLVMNAVQQSPPGSPIVVSATEHADGRAVISVQDNAGGIPESDLGRVFEAGWRASSPRTPPDQPGRTGGAGLGLAIVRGIVEAHRGEVVVHNHEGGCRFDVFLPAHPA